MSGNVWKCVYGYSKPVPIYIIWFSFSSGTTLSTVNLFFRKLFSNRLKMHLHLEFKGSIVQCKYTKLILATTVLSTKGKSVTLTACYCLCCEETAQTWTTFHWTEFKVTLPHVSFISRTRDAAHQSWKCFGNFWIGIKIRRPTVNTFPFNIKSR